jgi:formylglycine-generating enzyme required for sulfatase activity
MRSILLLAAILFSAFADLSAEAPEAARIKALIEQLGEDDFEKRESAMRALKDLGDRAIPALTEAMARSRDLEVRARAWRALKSMTPGKRVSRSTGMELVRIEPGQYRIGSPAGEAGRRADEEQRSCRIRKAFYLGVHEVTQGQYQKVMKANPSWFQPGGGGKDKVRGLATADFPVENVSWLDTIEFCNLLSRMDGLPAYYRMSALKRDGASIVSAEVKVLGGNGYRLPTEAEWEHACRAGTITMFGLGGYLDRGFANLKPTLVSIGYGSALEWEDLGRTAKVGTHRANGWGLHDMHGNVAEWCWDWYEKEYPADLADDPAGPEKGTQRVHRGGSWLVPKQSGRSASRGMQAPGTKSYTTGFRVARDP